MTHTFEVQIQVNKSTYSYLINNLPMISKLTNNTSRTNYYSKKGITQIELITYISNTNNYIAYYLKLRCNTAIIMGDNDILLLNDNKYTVNEIIQGFYKRLYEINEFRYIKLHEYKLDSFKVIRADFAVDIITKYKCAYIYLCNLSMPYKYRNMERPNIPKKDYVLYVESCYLTNKSRTLNIYSKSSAIVNKGLSVPSELEDLVFDTLRIEIQVKKNGIKSLNKRLSRKLNLNDIFSSDFCNSYLETELKQLFSIQDYVSYSEANRIISSSSYSIRKKKVLLSIIRAIQNLKGISNLEKAIINGATPYGNLRSFRRSLSEIEKLGIQPVVIPDNFGLSRLQSVTNILNNN